MHNVAAPAAAVTTIAAMVTPALLILASASLVASALVRMARVVDRARVLAAVAHEGSWEKHGMTPTQLGAWLERHARRACDVERSIVLLYAAVAVFVATCLAIPLDRTSGGLLGWLPVVLAIAGTLFLLGGSVWMVAESRLSREQIDEEIRHAVRQMEGSTR